MYRNIIQPKQDCFCFSHIKWFSHVFVYELQSIVFFSAAKSVLCFDRLLFPVALWSFCWIKQISLSPLVYMDPTSSKQWGSGAIIMLCSTVFFFFCDHVYPNIPVVVTKSKSSACTKLPNKASCRMRQLLQNTSETSKRHYQFVRNGNTSLQHCRNTSSWCWQLRCTLEVWSVQKRKSRSPHSKWTLPEETLSAVLLWAYKYYLAVLVLASILHPDGACVRNSV